MAETGMVPQRVVAALRVTRAGEVRETTDPALPWVVTDGAGQPIRPASDFLRHLLASGNSPASCRSYAYDLLRWLRFLAAVGVRWDRAQRGEVRDFVLWLRLAHNPARDRWRPGAPGPGEVNSRTGKPSLQVGYAPATINHQVAVLAAFYDYHAEAGLGPAVSPGPGPAPGDGGLAATTELRDD